MTRDEWSKAQPILTRALFLSAEEQRAVIESAFLDVRVRQELLDLLRRTSRLATSAVVSSAGASSTPDTLPPPDPPSPPLLEPSQSIADGRFVVVRQLGRGGMGEVYLAHDTKFGSLVALKVLYEAGLREAQHARLCSGHPHVVTTYDVFDLPLGGRTRTVLVMEYVPGKPANRLVDDGPQDLRAAVRWARHVAAAIAHAHDRNVLHCDLKPANILITPEDGAKVLDFGIGRATFDRPLPGERLRGTAPYMAPEHLLERRFSEAGDIYSLAVTLFEMVTGRLPFEGDTPDVVLQIVGVEAPRASSLRGDVPPSLDALLARALSKDPAARHRTARALDRALDGVEQELVSATSPVPAPLIAPIPSVRWQKARRAAVFVAAIVGLAAVSGLLTSWVFNFTVGRPRAFDSDSLVQQVVLGVRAAVVPAIIASVTVGIAAAIQVVGGLLLRMPAASRRRAAVAAFIGRRPDDVVKVLSLIVVGCAVAAIGLLVAFNDIVDAAFTSLSGAEPARFAPLDPANRDPQVYYRQLLPVLLALLFLAWRGVTNIAARHRRIVPAGARGASFSAMALLFLLMQAPYKQLTEHSQLPVVTVGGRRCYLLGESGSESRVYCPGWAVPRVRTVSGPDTRVVRCGFEESLYKGVSLTGCERAEPEAP